MLTHASKVGDLNLTAPIYSGTHDTLRHVAMTMRDHQIGSVLVSYEEGHRFGILTEQDIARALADGADPDQVSASDVMSDQLSIACPRDELADVARRMLQENIRHLPVRDGDRVLGVVSLRDIVRSLIDR